MHTTKQRLEAGDVIELGDIKESAVNQTRRGTVLIAVWDGDPEEYVLVRNNFEHGEDIDTVADDSKVLVVTDGTGMANPTAWLAVPKEAYGR
ncbi:hypothetical protein ACM16X_08870 [Haloarcula japonica]|uniref:hypothetical protein n=1 Tax=Haloarcula japonica TaxID=29282 RepID=UPI0039F6F1A3